MKQLVTYGCPYSPSVSSNERTTGNQRLITTGIFRLCRHPLYFFMLFAWTITPSMSLDRLVVIIYSCVYLYFGIPLEERKLIEIFGQDYINYQNRVPAVFPLIHFKTKKN